MISLQEVIKTDFRTGSRGNDKGTDESKEVVVCIQ